MLFIYIHEGEKPPEGEIQIVQMRSLWSEIPIHNANLKSETT